jgi:leucyl aminopeptidase
MNITVTHGRIENEASEALLLSHWEDEKALAGEAATLNTRLQGRLADLLKSGEFTGRQGQVSIVHIASGEPLRAKRVVLVGLGKRKDFSLEKIRQAMGTAAKAIRNLGATSFSAPLLQSLAGKPVALQDATGHGKGPAEGVGAIAQAMAEGALLGLYQFTTYRTEHTNNTGKVVKRMTLVVSDTRSLPDVREGVRVGQITGEAATFVRDLCNHPANVVTPTYIANEAKKVAKEAHVSCTVLDRPQMQRLGMGALLGVAQGSHEPPKFVILEYHGGPRAERPVVLVGKTVTFDSGGISLKPADNMEQMKADMTGGAAVLATIRAAARLRLPLNVVGIIPATENMPGGRAIKPGDILTSLSGKTIEVINTDAEGRLILADGLTYAARFKPAALVDIATLTGACAVALGAHAIAVLGNNDDLIGELKAAGEACGERAWQLPLWEEYYDQIKSDVADMKNTGGRPGGTITAAAFLSKFVSNPSWAHLDIASTDWSDKERACIPKGATGIGTRLLIRFLCNRANGRRKALGTRANGRRS